LISDQARQRVEAGVISPLLHDLGGSQHEFAAAIG
jgi:hypothetical protein